MAASSGCKWLQKTLGLSRRPSGERSNFKQLLGWLPAFSDSSPATRQGLKLWQWEGDGTFMDIHSPLGISQQKQYTSKPGVLRGAETSSSMGRPDEGHLANWTQD